MRRLVCIAAVCGVLLAGCSSTEGVSPTTSSSSVPEASLSPVPGPSGTAASDSDGDSGISPLLLDDIYYAWYGNPVFDSGLVCPDSICTVVDEAGSGCSMGGSGTLPDGIWAVEIDEWSETSLVVDLVCWNHLGHALTADLVDDRCRECYRIGPLTDPAMVQECSEAMAVDIVNDDPQLRTMALDPAAQYIDPSGEVHPLGWALESEHLFAAQPLVWIYVNSGRVTQVYQPFAVGG